MKGHSTWMNEQISKYRSLAGFLDNESHLNVNPTGQEKKAVPGCKLIVRLRTSSWIYTWILNRMSTLITDSLHLLANVGYCSFV